MAYIFIKKIANSKKIEENEEFYTKPYYQSLKFLNEISQ